MSIKTDGLEYSQISQAAGDKQGFEETLTAAASGRLKDITAGNIPGPFDEIGRHFINTQVNDL